MHNKGALAAIFSCVGILALIFIAGIAWFFRRKRQMDRRRNWIASMQPQSPRSYTMDPFNDPKPHSPSSVPTMRSVQQEHGDLLWGASGYGASNPRRISAHSNSDMPLSSPTHGQGVVPATTSVYPDPYPILRPGRTTDYVQAYQQPQPQPQPQQWPSDRDRATGDRDTSMNNPYAGYTSGGSSYNDTNDYYGHSKTKAYSSSAVAIGSAYAPNGASFSRHSTPSLYDDTPDPLGIQSLIHSRQTSATRQDQYNQSPTSALTRQGSLTAPLKISAVEPVMQAPPGPPRSQLRKNSLSLARAREFGPITPPQSTPSDDGPSKTPSPNGETRHQDVFSRKTLLDVSLNFVFIF